MIRVAHRTRISLACLLAALPLGYASAEPLKTPAELRKEQTTKLAEQLAGAWQLETAERTEDGKVYQNKFDNSKEPVCLVTFSDGKVVSKTKDGVPEVTKETASSEFFPPGSTYSFGDNHITQLEVQFPPTDDKKPGKVLKHLYFLDEDSLWLVIDNLTYDKYPAESDLLKGESVQRMSFHFVRVKKK